MTEITSDHDRRRGLPELRLHAFEDHERINELRATCLSHISEIRDILGEDYLLIADLFAELAAEINDNFQDDSSEINGHEPHHDTPVNIQKILDEINLFSSSLQAAQPTETLEPRKLTAWDFRKEVLAKTAAYEKLWWIQESIYGCPTGIEGVLDGRSDQIERFVAFIDKNAQSLCEIEEQILEEIKKAHFRYELYRNPLIEDRSIDEIRELSKEILFLDYHVFNGYLWNSAFMSVAAHCVRALDNAHLTEIISIREDLPKIFSKFFPEDFDSIPKLIEDLSQEISASLKMGLTLSQARDISTRYDLKRFGFVGKTWLDRLAAENKIEKGKLNGKVAYWEK